MPSPHVGGWTFFIGGRVQKMRNEELEMRNEGGGFAANYKREEMGIA